MMIVQAERDYGDELAEVHIMEVDSNIVAELRLFVETGQCSHSLFKKLTSMAPRIISFVPIDDAFSNAELRECICAAYVIKAGNPIEIAVKFKQQLK